MNRFHALRIALASAMLIVSSFACSLAQAQMYSWKDPVTGASRFSNMAPPWYSTGEATRGPRVVVSIGNRTVDDTSLPYEERLALSGMSKDAIEKLIAQQRLASRPPQAVNRDARARSDAEPARGQSAHATPAVTIPEGRKGS